MKNLSPWLAEAIALAAQGAVFAGGLSLSVAVGMFLAKLWPGPGGLLIATAVSAAGLLVFAGLSQTVRDALIADGLDV